MWNYFILPATCFLCVLSLVYPWLFSSSKTKEIKYSDKIIGIDLGTTYSCVGVFRNGRVEIIANDQGNRITPSCVSFTKDGQCLVGEGAKNELPTNPENTVYDVKRLIGRKMDDPVVQKDIKIYPFKVVDKENKPHIRVIAGTRGAKTFAPEEISSLVLSRMKEIASSYLGEQVRNAVITVPAYFTNAQRQATKDAGAIAGLNVVRIINEPTAAGIAYGLEKNEGKVVLVFDLGGGTFDVSIMKTENKVFKVLSTGGDTHLGGEDFDQRVLEFFIDLFKRKKGEDITNDKRAVQKLKREVEKAKRLLSYQLNARVEVDSLYRGIDFSETLSKARFEELNMDLFRKTTDTVRQLLVDAKLSAGDVDEMILVGGSTRIPKIREMLEEMFDGKEPYRDINPDEAVAYGAAVLGGSLGENREVDVLLEDVNPLTLGVEMVGQIMANIIPRNTPLPTKMSQPFTRDNQRMIAINVYEGERPMVKANHLLGSFELYGIKPAPRMVPEIEITFEVDQEGILKVTAVDHGSGSQSSIDIQQDKHKLSQEQIENMIHEAEIFAEEDRKMKAIAAAKNELESLLYSVMYHLERVTHDEEQREITRSANKIAVWLEHNRSASVEDYDYQREILEEIMATVMNKIGRVEL